MWIHRQNFPIKFLSFNKVVTMVSTFSREDYLNPNPVTFRPFILADRNIVFIFYLILYIEIFFFRINLEALLNYIGYTIYTKRAKINPSYSSYR